VASLNFDRRAKLGAQLGTQLGGPPDFPFMRLIAVYIVFVIVGVLISLGVGEVVEYWSEQASLFVFLALFFGSLWAGWKLALKVT
jgi:hypothetical protein